MWGKFLSVKLIKLTYKWIRVHFGWFFDDILWSLILIRVTGCKILPLEAALYKSLFLYLKLRTINCQTGYSQEAYGRVFTHTITHFPLTHTHTESLFNEFESRGGLLSMKWKQKAAPWSYLTINLTIVP